jgi:hypothetical protein
MRWHMLLLLPLPLPLPLPPASSAVRPRTLSL